MTAAYVIRSAEFLGNEKKYTKNVPLFRFEFSEMLSAVRHTQIDRHTHTCDPLHLHAAGLDATLGEPLLGDDAADVVGEDEVGLQDGQRLGVRVGAGLVDDDVERPAVVLHTRHLHVLEGEEGSGGQVFGGESGTTRLK